MILVWGSVTDPPAQRVLELLQERGQPVLHIDQAALAGLRYDVTLAAVPGGWIESQGLRVAVQDIAGIYLRPEAGGTAAAAEAAMVLMGLAAGLDATVVNRPWAGLSNGSKPFQLQLIADCGFSVPDTLVTTDPAAALAFVQEQGRIVYKSVSGVRSIVATLTPADAARLQTVANGPVQFQRWIAGRDLRVHVVGSRCFATAVDSPASDYRYAAREGAAVTLSATTLPRELGRRLVALTRRLGLVVAGIDLRLTPAGEWVCFEVNPSPGFSFYEDATGQPIGEAVVDLLLQPRAHRATQRSSTARTAASRSALEKGLSRLAQPDSSST